MFVVADNASKRLHSFNRCLNQRLVGLELSKYFVVTVGRSCLLSTFNLKGQCPKSNYALYIDGGV